MVILKVMQIFTNSPQKSNLEKCFYKFQNLASKLCGIPSEDGDAHERGQVGRVVTPRG